MNRTIKEATVKRFHYVRHDQLRTHLADFMATHNFARRLTPYEYTCKIWTSELTEWMKNARSTDRAIARATGFHFLSGQVVEGLSASPATSSKPEKEIGMTRNKHVSASSILALSAFAAVAPVPASAVEVDVTTGANAEASVDAEPTTDAVQGAKTTVESEAGKAAQSGKMTLGSVLAGLNASAEAMAETSAAVSGADAGVDAQFSITTVSALKAGSDTSDRRVEQALDAQADSMGRLRQAIRANASLSAAIEAKGYDVDDVVGISAQSENRTMIVVDDTA